MLTRQHFISSWTGGGTARRARARFAYPNRDARFRSRLLNRERIERGAETHEPAALVPSPLSSPSRTHRASLEVQPNNDRDDGATDLRGPGAGHRAREPAAYGRRTRPRRLLRRLHVRGEAQRAARRGHERRVRRAVRRRHHRGNTRGGRGSTRRGRRAHRGRTQHTQVPTAMPHTRRAQARRGGRRDGHAGGSQRSPRGKFILTLV